MAFVTEAIQHKTKRYFFYKNILDENSRITFTEHYKNLQDLKIRTQRNSQPSLPSTILTPKHEYKLMFAISSGQEEKPQPTSGNRQKTQNTRLNSESIPSQLGRLETEFSQKITAVTKRQNLTRRNPIENQKYQGELELKDYLAYLRYQQHCKKKDLETSATPTKGEQAMMTVKQLKQTHFKSIRAEHYANLYRLYYSAHAVHCVNTTQSITLQDIVDIYLETTNQKQTNQFSQMEQIIDQFLNDLVIASNIYNSERLKASALAKITGIDYKIFHMMYKSKRPLIDEKFQEFTVDESFLTNYQPVKVTRNDILSRIFGAGELPQSYQEHLHQIYSEPGYTPFIMEGQFKEKEYAFMKQKIENEFGNGRESWLKNRSKIEIDLDFVRRLLYYQKNLQISLKNKQSDLLANKEIQLQQYKKRNKYHQDLSDFAATNAIKEQQTLLYRLENLEQQIGGFPLIARSNRILFDNLDKIQNIQEKIKS